MSTGEKVLSGLLVALICEMWIMRPKQAPATWDYFIWKADEYPRALIDRDSGKMVQYDVYQVHYDTREVPMKSHYWTNSCSSIAAALTTAGRQGWELAAYDGQTASYIFKRPVGNWYWEGVWIMTRLQDVPK